jgi:transcription termination/antitermination protein NusA
VAVYSKDPDVDCVGACVGMKGMRVQSIIRELKGEKIDIIEYNEDPVTFAGNALSPAKINHVSIVDAEEKHLEVIVDDTQLSLAIGKKGQNVRLAAKLLGWHIDIKSEEEKRQEIESQMAAMARRGAAITELAGLGEKTLGKLRNHGVETVEQLAQMTPDELMEIQGIGEKTVDKIRAVVTEYFEQGSSTAAGEEEAQSGEEPAGKLEESGTASQSEPEDSSDESASGLVAAESESVVPEQGEALEAESSETASLPETPDGEPEASLSEAEASTPSSHLQTSHDALEHKGGEQEEAEDDAELSGGLSPEPEKEEHHG